MNNSTKKIVIICFSDFTKEPRVLRTIQALKKEYELIIYSSDVKATTINYCDISKWSNDYEVKTTNVPLKKAISFINRFVLKKAFGSTKYYNEKYWRGGRKIILNKLKGEKAHVYIGHGIYSVPLLAELSKDAKTIFNAHEYYLREFEENESWLKYTQPYYQYMLDVYLTKVNKLFSVSKVIGEEYLKKYNLPMTVVTNATNYNANLNPVECQSNSIKLVHHGAAIRTRQLELMAEAVLRADKKFNLTFILVPTDEVYLHELINRYANEEKILFKQPVNVNDIAIYINSFDIGLFFLPPVNFNWENALPNKLFEFIQARLCVVVSPNPDMKRVVEENKIGVVTKDYTLESLVKIINSLTATTINEFKQNAHVTAAKLNGDVTMKTILNEVKLLLN